MKTTLRRLYVKSVRFIKSIVYARYFYHPRGEIIHNLVKHFKPNRLRSSDEIFYSMGKNLRDAPKRGKKITAEEAFFLYTDKGIATAKEEIKHWEDFKKYVIALRLLTITAGQWKEEWEKMSTIERASFRKELEDEGHTIPSFMRDVNTNQIEDNIDVCLKLSNCTH